MQAARKRFGILAPTRIEYQLLERDRFGGRRHIKVLSFAVPRTRAPPCAVIFLKNPKSLMDRNGRRRPGVADQNFKIASR